MNMDKFSNAVSLTEEIENIIRERILKGDYGIGGHIKESQVAEELKVSRTPIREAFKQLEKEGLIQSIPNRGSFALGLTKQDVQDIYAVRAAVEVLAIEWAATRITEEEIAKLKDTFDLMEFYTKKYNSKKVLELNKDFHRIIYSAAGSRLLAQILNSYHEYVEQTRKVSVYCKENLETILKEHWEILEAIAEKDPQKAVERVSAHLANSRMRAEQGLKL
jgi:GntR family transcriptional regulator, rspAB operon transcriptional repressor